MGCLFLLGRDALHASRITLHFPMRRIACVSNYIAFSNETHAMRLELHCVFQ